MPTLLEKLSLLSAPTNCTYILLLYVRMLETSTVQECNCGAIISCHSSMSCPALCSFLCLLHSFFLFLCGCSLSCGVGNRDVQFMAERLTVTCSHHIDHLWVSIAAILHCKRKLHWSKLIATVIYGYQRSYLDDSLVDTSYLLSKITATLSRPPGSMTYPDIGVFDNFHTTRWRWPPMEWTSNLIRVCAPLLCTSCYCTSGNILPNLLAVLYTESTVGEERERQLSLHVLMMPFGNGRLSCKEQPLTQFQLDFCIPYRVVSSTMRSYHFVLLDNQEQCQFLVLIWKCQEPSWPTNLGRKPMPNPGFLFNNVVSESRFIHSYSVSTSKILCVHPHACMCTQSRVLMCMHTLIHAHMCAWVH